MHGRPRNKPSSNPEDEKLRTDKFEKLFKLQSEFLHNHHKNIYDEDAMKLSAELLAMNPEYITAWNYRKMAVDYHLAAAADDPDDGAVDRLLNRELDVAKAALRTNYKSYGAWHHRKWVLSKCRLSLDKEMGLINEFQVEDSRNFHAWNHRRFVAALMNSSEIDELKYTEAVIGRNFSNYSAWHNRSVILSSLLKKNAEGFSPKEHITSAEYGLVHNAIFTEPDDQSGWFYYLWLLDQTIDRESPSVISSWPAPGSEFLIFVDKSSVGTVISPLGSYHTDSWTFPLVLYFNEPVKGVSSSTITVKSLFTERTVLTWRPLSTSNDCARAWVAHLDCSNVVCGSSKTYSVEVRCEDPHGITSLNGFHCNHAFVSKFVVRFQHFDSSQAIVQDTGVISWKDCDFQRYEGKNKEHNPIPFFEQSVDRDQDASSSQGPGEILANEIALLRELLAESVCKIGKLMLARLLTAFDTVVDDTSSSGQVSNFEEILRLYSDLMALDPPHLEYYKDQRSLTLLCQATSSSETLSGHCWHYTDSSVSGGGKFTCLRFNNFSLTRFGSIERLMWVQMLDLSHNELRSVDGLEAMQSLSCLNLSNNKLGSFTALDPLRRLKSLKVLNISNNEIGGRSIDTTRYLFSSPLSHAVGVDWHSDYTLPMGDIVSAKLWEAVFVLRDLKLTQLDIAGNPVVNEAFMLLLRRLLPKLVWLDGSKLNTI